MYQAKWLTRPVPRRAHSFLFHLRRVYSSYKPSQATGRAKSKGNHASPAQIAIWGSSRRRTALITHRHSLTWAICCSSQRHTEHIGNWVKVGVLLPCRIKCSCVRIHMPPLPPPGREESARKPLGPDVNEGTCFPDPQEQCQLGQLKIMCTSLSFDEDHEV